MPPEQPGSAAAALEFACPHCGASARTARAGRAIPCPRCRGKIGAIAQLEQLLARWYEPRRWRADLVRPSVPYLLERLWTANGQGERLYQGVEPRYANYDVFRNMVTRLIIQGVDEGWAEITFPPDPFVEDPQYRLRIVDADRFARGVERLFPEVDWDEAVPAALIQSVGERPPVPRRRGRVKGKTRQR